MLSLKRRGKFLNAEVASLTGSPASHITSPLWFPLLSCHGRPRCSHVVLILYLSHARLCVEIGLLRERHAAVEMCRGCISCRVCFSYHAYNNSTQKDVVRRFRLLRCVVLLSRKMAAASCCCHTNQSAAVKKEIHRHCVS